MLDLFRPLLEAAHGLDLADPARARTLLDQRFDPQAPAAAALNERLIEKLCAGELAPKGALPVKWGRAAKAGPESLDFSIDVVHMNGAGPRHRHPAGEVNWCVPLAGAPTFEGVARGWVVMPRESVHVPAVVGGEMLIVYLLPRGEIEFLEA